LGWNLRSASYEIRSAAQAGSQLSKNMVAGCFQPHRASNEPAQVQPLRFPLALRIFLSHLLDKHHDRPSSAYALDFFECTDEPHQFAVYIEYSHCRSKIRKPQPGGQTAAHIVEKIRVKNDLSEICSQPR
jgi:hypothetical protein